MNVLCMNPGSGTLRYRLFDTLCGCKELDGDMIDRIRGAQEIGEAAKTIFKSLDPSSLDCVAIRVVHGGDQFIEPTLVNPRVIQDLRQFEHLAPLHLPTDLAVLEAACRLLDCPVYAVFDTMFHRPLPDIARYYPLPSGIREKYPRYGFHGFAHQSVSEIFRNAPSSVEHSTSTDRIISLHFGGGASACAVLLGKSVATTMGMTPLDGLMMSTRSGSIDPGIVLSLLRDGQTVDEVDRLLNQRSGLLGVSGISADTRDVLPAMQGGDANANLAIDMYVQRVRQTVGALIATLQGCDALLISGALVKDSVLLRKRLLSNLACFDIRLCEESNQQSDELKAPTRLSRQGVTIAYVPAREEQQMALALMRHMDAGG